MWGTFGEKAGGLGNRGPGISVSPRDFFLWVVCGISEAPPGRTDIYGLYQELFT